jgi:hypothetical protein
MPPSAGVRTIIKNAVGGDFDNDTVDAYWDDLAEIYSDARTLRTAVIVELLRVRVSQAAGRVDYQMNEEREALSQEAKALVALLGAYEKELAGQMGAVRIGVPRKVPSRSREWPHD